MICPRARLASSQPRKGRVHVQLQGSIKALRPANLKVVQPPRDTNEMLNRVLEVFQRSLAVKATFVWEVLGWLHVQVLLIVGKESRCVQVGVRCDGTGGSPMQVRLRQLLDSSFEGWSLEFVLSHRQVLGRWQMGGEQPRVLAQVMATES